MSTEPNKKESTALDSFEKFLKYSALSLSGIGIIIIIVFLSIIANKLSIGSKNLDMAATGQVGDFIGGLVGSMWAFAGVILFYLALRLQRKEFASQTEQLRLQKDELNLQRKELKNQRQEFRIGRITNIIYKQKEIINSVIKDLHLIIPTRKINSKGIDAISMFGNWSTICIPKDKPLVDFTTTENQEFQNFDSFILSNPFKDYMNSLKNSIELCLKLISQKDSEGKSLNEYDIRNLMFLLLKNFDLEKLRFMFSEIKRMHSMQLKRVKENDGAYFYIDFLQQEVSKYENLLLSINVIKKACT